MLSGATFTVVNAGCGGTTSTTAVSVFQCPATRAEILYVPVLPAVNIPVGVIVPPEADHLTNAGSSGAISNSSPWSVTGTVTMSYVGGGCFNNFDEAVVVDCYDSLPGCGAPWTYVGSVSLKQNEYNIPRQLPTVTTPGHTLCCDYRKTDKEWTPCWQGCCNRNIQTTWQATSCQ